jgi:glycosyltransferase involved in cell wall biosynthesis
VEVSLVVPILNNRANGLAFCIDFLQANLGSTRLILVDNGSDESERLKNLEDMAPDRIKVVTLKVNEGFGGGIQAGLVSADSEWVAWLPGNMKVKPSGLRDYIDFVRSQDTNTLVKAYRSGRSFGPRAKTFLASAAQSVVSGTLLYDTGGTPTALHKDNSLLSVLLNGPKDYSFECFALFMARLDRVNIVRVHVAYGDRLHGTSHWQYGLGSELRLMSSILLRIPQWRKSYRLQKSEGRLD